MAATNIDGPIYVYGDLANIEAGTLSPEAVPDPNIDAGPSMFYQGTSVFDPRIIFGKDKVLGFTGTAQGFMMDSMMASIANIPFTAGAANIANLGGGVTTGVPITFAAASAGIYTGIPVRIFSPVTNAGAIQVAAITMDFGFDFAAVTAGNPVMTVANINSYFVGMPVVIAGVGTSVVGAAPLLTFITAVNIASSQITVFNAPQSASTGAAVGTGDLWGPTESVPATGGFPIPAGALPFLANGPSLVLDPRQCVSRCIGFTQITGSSAGNILVNGADIYGMPMTQLVALPGGVAVTYTKKAFKYIFSITPQFTDTGHALTIGTSDIFGFAHRAILWEDTQSTDGGGIIVSSDGFTPADQTNPATNLTGDVRGTMFIGTLGTGTAAKNIAPGGTAIATTSASNGSLAGTTLSGRRLEMRVIVPPFAAVSAQQLTPYYLMGVTQA